MAAFISTPALLALALGLFYCAAALGELLRPGQWVQVIEELPASPFARLIGGAAALGTGALLIALVPPRTGDWLNLWLFGLGCLAVLEGLVLLMMPGQMTLLARAITRHGSRPMALLTFLLGVAFILAGIIRI